MINLNQRPAFMKVFPQLLAGKPRVREQCVGYPREGKEIQWKTAVEKKTVGVKVMDGRQWLHYNSKMCIDLD